MADTPKRSSSLEFSPYFFHRTQVDRGWFGVDERYKIRIAQNIEETAPNNRALREFEGESLYLPNHELYYPRIEALQWHLETVFQQASPDEGLFDQIA